MTHKKTHKEPKSMPSAAKKLAIVQNNEPALDAAEVAQQEPALRAEELRLLEALLFAAASPLDEASMKRRLPDGVDLKDALARLQAEYSTRGVNLVKGGEEGDFRTA